MSDTKTGLIGGKVFWVGCVPGFDILEGVFEREVFGESAVIYVPYVGTEKRRKNQNGTYVYENMRVTGGSKTIICKDQLFKTYALAQAHAECERERWRLGRPIT